jgi:prevent-host-death family protein
MSGKLSDMKSVTVRELQQQTKRVIERVEHGEVIEVVRRRRPVARLSPVPQPQMPSAWPDLAQRVRSVFGKRTVKPGASRAVSDARGER